MPSIWQMSVSYTHLDAELNCGIKMNNPTKKKARQRKLPGWDLQLDLLQAEQSQDIDLEGLDKLLKRGALVGAVHGAGKVRDGNVGMLRSEADGIRDLSL